MMCNDRIPTKGEVFACKLNSLKKIIIVSNGNGTNYFSDSEIKSDIIGDNYLIFTYLGNGLAREYYTSNLFNVLILNDNEDEDIIMEIPCYRTYDINNNNYDFYQGYKKILRHPLAIRVSTIYLKSRLFMVDKELKNKVDSICDDVVIHELNKLENEAKENLINQMNKIIYNDHKAALIENKKYTLEKNKS